MSAIAHMVRQTLNASIEPPKATGPVTPDELRQMMWLHRQGLNMQAIGDRIGRPRGTVWHHLKKARV